ncbi:hypothetical protein V5E97_10600 [Singulisphaera sp. Ch08]|uniref:Uncharacterized protein n=1 Tax=Singulisphaera sp. Ch08 TaxID=3120278 RepID=A0AAU7CN75_9BACT
MFKAEWGLFVAVEFGQAEASFFLNGLIGGPRLSLLSTVPGFSLLLEKSSGVPIA